jgi:hypothetical protein
VARVVAAPDLHDVLGLEAAVRHVEAERWVSSPGGVLTRVLAADLLGAPVAVPGSAGLVAVVRLGVGAVARRVAVRVAAGWGQRGLQGTC